jgi:hypothetical protein
LSRNILEPPGFELEAEACGNALQFTILALSAISTVEVMMAHEQLKGGASQPLHFWGIKAYTHAILGCFCAGSNRSWPAIDFDEA